MVPMFVQPHLHNEKIPYVYVYIIKKKNEMVMKNECVILY